MKVLITGGLGQIGSFTAESLLSSGNNVCVIDNLYTGRITHLAPNDNLSVYIDDINELDRVSNIFSMFKPDIVFHTAASYKDPNNWYNDTLTNCVASVNLINESMKNNVKRFIYLNTALCYGQKLTHGSVKEDDLKNPAISSYSISKNVCEDYLMLSGIDYVSFRLSNIIGPRNLVGPLPIFYKRLTEGKKCLVTDTYRDFVFVKDFIEYVIKACQGVGNGIYNFSSGNEISIMQLYNTVVKEMGFEVYPIPEAKKIGKDDTLRIHLDSEKIFKDFGRVKFTNINEIVKSAIKYYKMNPIINEYTHLKIN